VAAFNEALLTPQIGLSGVFRMEQNLGAKKELPVFELDKTLAKRFAKKSSLMKRNRKSTNCENNPWMNNWLVLVVFVTRLGGAS